MAPPPPPPATLPEELIEDILIRFPPEEPASLFRAALVCKPWCRLISGARFRRKFRELHRTPPMLGSLLPSYDGARFVPATASRPPRTDCFGWVALDARHGRVLARRYVPGEAAADFALVVWDPITGEQRRLPLPSRRAVNWAAAVVCAATATGACDHLDCHRGPFLVVFVGLVQSEMFLCTYSSDVSTWTRPIRIGNPDPGNPYLVALDNHSVLVGNALYFWIQCTDLILTYNLESSEMSLTQLPSTHEWWNLGCSMLTTIEEGVWGFITVEYSELCIWAMEDSPEVDAAWTKNRIINLMTMLPRSHDGAFTSPSVVGVTDRLGIVFLMVGSVIYTLDLKTCEVKVYQDKLYEDIEDDYAVVPYMSFYTPELDVACTGEEPSAGGSNA